MTKLIVVFCNFTNPPKMMDRTMAAYWNGGLVDIFTQGTVKYCLMLWPNLGICVIKLDRC
jgi:hypothetical protein